LVIVQSAIEPIGMKAAISLVPLVLATSFAPTVDLTCSGVMHNYGSNHDAAAVPPGAAIVDLENRTISAPVGNFRITTVSDDSISFDDPAKKQLVLFGTLDRCSGLMRVFWRNPGDDTQAVMYSELKCSTLRSLLTRLRLRLLLTTSLTSPPRGSFAPDVADAFVSDRRVNNRIRD
jgi:hypothetical protein